MPGDQCYDPPPHSSIRLRNITETAGKQSHCRLTQTFTAIWEYLGMKCAGQGWCLCGSLALVHCYLVKAQMITILLSISWLPADQGEKLLKILQFYYSQYCSALVELSNKRLPQAVKWKYPLDWTRYSHTVNCPPALLYFLSLRFAVFLLKIWWIGPIFLLSDHKF